jgi:hypothetical protein
MAFTLRDGLPAEAYAQYRLHLACLTGVPADVSEEAASNLADKGFDREVLHLLLELSDPVPVRIPGSDAQTDAPKYSSEFSKTLYGIASGIALAFTVFGEKDKALRWLKKPKDRFEGRAPLDVLQDVDGQGQVISMLVQIGEGIGA